MLHQPRSLKRSLVVGLAVCAIAPATAAASPIQDQAVGATAPATAAASPIQGQAVAAGGGSGVSAQDFAPQRLTAPDQVDRGPQATKANPGPPQWPANPRAVGVVHPTTSAQPSADSGVDTGVLIALGSGGALLLAGGLGVAGRKRLQTGRRSQLA
jgi:hypothetical protein